MSKKLLVAIISGITAFACAIAVVIVIVIVNSGKNDNIKNNEYDIQAIEE